MADLFWAYWDATIRFALLALALLLIASFLKRMISPASCAGRGPFCYSVWHYRFRSHLAAVFLTLTKVCNHQLVQRRFGEA